jgi:hypothetical protein
MSGTTKKSLKESKIDDIPTVEAIPVMGSASKALSDWQEKSWVGIQDWLVIFKIFILIGVTIFTIGQFTGVSDTDLAAYIWFAFGLIITWVLSLRLVAKQKNNEVGIWSAISTASVMLPTLGTLLPLGVLIYVLIRVRPILQNNLNNLPKQFFWFNRLTFFLVVMQMFILNKFYSTGSTNGDNSSRPIWIASMILFSVLTSAAAIELYVIITAFLTDG